MFTLAVVGHRDFHNYKLLCSVLSRVHTPIDRIVSGAARGADTLAARYAKEHGIDLVEYPADWGRYGKKAGYLRNRLIVADADAMIAFLHPESRGTRMSVELAQEKGIPVYIVHLNED